MNHPWVIYLQACLSVRIQRARNAPSRGASAVEWVIISAIIAGVALGLATLIKQLVEGKQNDLQTSFGQTGGRT
ncbi:Flp family type IVb pilin [Nonomuraea sp. NPDC050022]|uniref:Flp family type IVb pilin n=1 Tax=unclassified Nonomuraea TaxID=2593643 RepID=UPI0033E98F0D